MVGTTLGCLMLPSMRRLGSASSNNSACSTTKNSPRQLCAPPDLGLQIRETSALGSTSLDGLVRDGSVWQSPNYESAVHRADLDVSVNLGNLDLNPIGGCK